jgi:hypothetical protein
MKTNNAGLRALTVDSEHKEIAAVGMRRTPVQLKRTYDWVIDGETLKFWRVLSPWHPNFHSDLTAQGLKACGIIQ